MDQVQQCSELGTLVPCQKRNDYAEEAVSISIAEVIERKLWAIYVVGLIFRISAKGLLLNLERLGILEKLRDATAVLAVP